MTTVPPLSGLTFGGAAAGGSSGPPPPITSPSPQQQKPGAGGQPFASPPATAAFGGAATTATANPLLGGRSSAPSGPSFAASTGQQPQMLTGSGGIGTGFFGGVLGSPTPAASSVGNPLLLRPGLSPSQQQLQQQQQSPVSVPPPGATFARSDYAGDGGLRRRRPPPGGATSDENDMTLANSRAGGVGVGPAPPPKRSLALLSSSGGRYADDVLDDASGKGGAGGAKKASASSASSTTASSALALAAAAVPRTVDEYSRWVVVYGFQTPLQCKAVLRRFESYGTVLSVKGGGVGGGGVAEELYATTDRNWICLRYGSALQAEKALCQHGTFLESGHGAGIIIVGVMRLDGAMARKLGVAPGLGGEGTESRATVADAIATRGGAVDVAEGGVRYISPKNGRPAGRALLAEDDVLLMGGASGRDRRMYEGAQRRDVCEKIMSWVFSW